MNVSTRGGSSVAQQTRISLHAGTGELAEHGRDRVQRFVDGMS